MASLALADLATRLSLDPKLIHVLSIDLVEWPDAALGCPRPGETSAEHVEPGYLIVLEANRQEHIYHTDNVDKVILCADNERPFSLRTPSDIDDSRPWMPVEPIMPDADKPRP